MNAKTLLLPSALIFLIAGCANMSTISRSTQMPGGGLAIHLDAAQRVVFSNKEGVVCAEPTPDALQSYAASLGAGVSVPSKGAASLTDALVANSASVGLHTQSITLMRDALFRICEAAHNNKLDNSDVVQLLERSQDMTLGALAIEQLTGAVVARQVILTGGANATASANVANTQAALDSAKKNEELKKNALAVARSAQQTQSALVDKTKQNIATEQNKPNKDQAAIDKLNSQLTTQQAELDKDNDAVKNAQGAHATAQLATQTIEANFNSAIASAQAAANGSGSFSIGTDRNNIDKDTVAQIAEATKYIVLTVTTKGHLTDTCINLMSKYANEDNPTKREALETLNTQCQEVIKVYLEVYRATLGAGMPVAAPGSSQKPASQRPASPPQPFQ